MARPQRIELPNAFYHVSNGSMPGKLLFPQECYASAFLEQVITAGKRLNVEIHAWHLQKGQYQLLLRTPEANLSRFMRQVDGLFTQRYQQMSGKQGSIFKARYKAVLIQAGPWVAEVAHHMHHSAEAGKGGEKQWPWSSLGLYAGRQAATFPLVTAELLAPFGKGQRARDALIRQAATSPTQRVQKYFAKRSRPSLLGDDDFKQELRRAKQTKRRRVPVVAKPAVKRPPINKVVTVVAGTFKVSPRSIVQAARGPGSKNVPRWVAMYLCQELGGATLQEIAEQFGLQRYGTVSTTIGKLKNESLNDLKLQQRVRRLESALTMA